MTDAEITPPEMRAREAEGASQLGDWITLIGFGAIGHVMRRAGWPRPPVVLGFVLGPIMETNLDLSRQAFGWTWFWRTWVLAMLAVLVLVAASSASVRRSSM